MFVFTLDTFFTYLFFPRLVTNHLPHLTVGELIIQDELLLDPMWSAETDSSEFDTPLVFELNDLIPLSCSPEQLDSGIMKYSLVTLTFSR